MAYVLGNHDDLLRNYILRPDIPIHDPKPEVIERSPNIERLYSISACPSSSSLAANRNQITGEVIDFIEVNLENVGANAKSSMSMQRAPGPLEEATRGSAMNFPFWPGGFDEPEKSIQELNIELDVENVLSVPPGFSRGAEFASKQTNTTEDSQMEVNLLQALEFENEIKEWIEINEEPKEVVGQNCQSEAIDDILLTIQNPPVLEISKTIIRNEKKTEWAEMIDISQPVTDFETRIPEPALTYQFELDVFQKQAIMKLEERQYVFVAAHTSAGKTVVAEYAIALSQKHMTRAIYTSPIKTLSNQKYRDFKQMFQDVGLITGDFQINPTASCLIMTTEILRSMLYCGSDCTRDLEYVIFDEVHYINDCDRGHVWEEVFILLPAHVNIIMLSATVSNTLEFANWVGSTKKRKVYVISTLKRPVPLMHYLYTGCGRKKSDDLFLIVDDKRNFIESNYIKAEKSAPEFNYWGPKQEKTLLEGLIYYLKNNNKLPVVSFTLSRNRCDNNAKALSVDLNDAREEAEVQKFVQHCLQTLKPPDRSLPQVLTMKNLLKRGIGVHHSGILPILKEIVEMLFQKGLVKVLFATETFAMGVNMPTKTVVFDSWQKHDGKERRKLKPAEYTQMAGRAGRRGHDLNGTVIIVCTKKMPGRDDLKSIILGQPDKLQSQFVLRYAMILICLRIEDIKVEDMMLQSFKEFDTKLGIPEREKELKIAEEKMSDISLADSLAPLCSFFDVATKYIEIKKALMIKLLFQPRVIKELKPGRVLIISQNNHYNKLAILLSVKSPFRTDSTLKVLVLDHANNTNDVKATMVLDKTELWHRLIALTPQYQYFIPEGIGGHSLLQIKLTDVIEITKAVIKVEANTILQNCEMRQIERFRDNPPDATVLKAITDLKLLNDSYSATNGSIQLLKITQELNVTESEVLDMYNDLTTLERELKEMLPITNIANFEQEFYPVFEKKSWEKKVRDIKFKNSPQNLSLYPDYCNKINVLRALKYIDDHDGVTLKGKVACEMGQNELIITELILRNIFNDLDAAEIAALLSPLVCPSRKEEGDHLPKDIELPEKLKKSLEELKSIKDMIQKEEAENKVTPYEVNEKLNFCLVKVVYEWACNKPFATIMELVEDIQEGIIVRCIQQLDEILRDVKKAAMRIGNPGVQSKMEDASNAIKRDIVFAESLYTSK